MVEPGDWGVMKGMFPADWEQLGRRSGAVRRLRGFSSLDSLLRTLLLHVGCGWSLRETAVQAKLAGLANVSDVTLLNRLRDSESWLRQLCEMLFAEQGVDLRPRLGARQVRLLDATVVSEPGRRAASGVSITVCACRRWSVTISFSPPRVAQAPRNASASFVFGPEN